MFTTKEEVDNYFNESSDCIRCLICEKNFKYLAPHIRIHGISADDYKVMFGIPYGYGLMCKITEALMIKKGKEEYLNGKFQINRQRGHQGKNREFAPCTKSEMVKRLSKAPSFKERLENIPADRIMTWTCQECGNAIAIGARTVYANKSVVKCRECKLKSKALRQDKWRKENPEKYKEQHRRGYRKKLAMKNLTPTTAPPERSHS